MVHRKVVPNSIFYMDFLEIKKVKFFYIMVCDTISVIFYYNKNVRKKTILNYVFYKIFFQVSKNIFKDKIIVSTDPYLYLLNVNNGSVIFRSSITSIVKPVISKNNLFIITKDNLLVCINIDIEYTDVKKNYSSF